jgi:hypothetical protein
MDEMREIVTMEQANALFLALAVAAPLLGVVIGAVIGGRYKNTQAGALKGLVVGMLGPLNLLLWKTYNGITDRMGLDTVKNLLVQLALFAGLGLTVGLIAGVYRRRSGPQGGGLGDGLTPVGVGPSGPLPERGGGAERRAEESDERSREP